jgi:transposase InsO family protein
VLPDALSRVYRAAYEDGAVWGVHDNITFQSTIGKVLTVADVLSSEELEANRLMSTTEIEQAKRRALKVTKVTVATMTDSGVFVPGSLSSSVTLLDEVDPSDLTTMEDITVQGNKYGALVCSVQPQNAGASFGEEYEFQQAIHEAAKEARLERQHRRYTQQVQMHTITTRAQNKNDEGSIGFQLPADQQSALYDEVEDVNDESTDDDADYVERKRVRRPVTDQERLLIAMEKRGRELPPVIVRKSLIEIEHALGHFGVDHVYDRLYRVKKVWWPGMRRDIQYMLYECDACLQYNVYMARWHPSQTVTASYPGQHWQMDVNVIGEAEDGSRYILTLVDVFTGFVILKALKTGTAIEVGRALLEVWGCFGPPKILSCDNAPNFVNEVLTAMHQLTGVEPRYITKYHPQASGKVERCNQTVTKIIQKLHHGEVRHWPALLPIIQMAINRLQKRITGQSPFVLMFGREMHGFEDYQGEVVTSVEEMNMDEWLEYQQKLIRLIYPAVGQRAAALNEQRRQQLDRLRHVVQKQLPVGTIVLLRDPTYLKGQPKPKMASKWLPSKYRVIDVGKNNAYKLCNEDTGQELDRRVTLDQMRRISGPSVPDAEAAEDRGEEYEIEFVIGDRNEQGRTEYLVRWKGYDEDDDSWVKAEHLHSPARLKLYTKLKRQLRRTPTIEEQRHAMKKDKTEDQEELQRTRRRRQQVLEGAQEMHEQNDRDVGTTTSTRDSQAMTRRQMTDEADAVARIETHESKAATDAREQRALLRQQQREQVQRHTVQRTVEDSQNEFDVRD